MFGSVIIWLKLVAAIPLLEKGIFEVGNIFLCIIFIFGLILTLIERDGDFLAVSVPFAGFFYMLANPEKKI